MSDDEITAQVAHRYEATVTLYTPNGTIDAGPVVALPGQAVEARVTQDSATGRINTVEVVAFDVSR